MKIFHAIDQPDIIPTFYEKTGIKLNVLVSYHYLERNALKLTEKYRDIIGLLYLDSGAFSVKTGRSTITKYEYLRYLRKYGDRFDAVFNLDDDFEDPGHNLENQLFLERGLSDKPWKPIPVTHDTQDPFGEFSMYADMGHTYIAMGSNQKSMKDEIFQRIRDTYPHIRIHLFGNLSRRTLMKYKPYSADSAGYAHVAGFGWIYYWDPIEAKEHQIYLGVREKWENVGSHFMKFPHRKELQEFLDKTFGYTYYDLLINVQARWVVNFYFFQQFENYVNASY